MSVDTRPIGKLQGLATTFRLIVTVAAGLLAFAIFTGVTAEGAIASGVLLLLGAIAGPLVHGIPAPMLRDGREHALEITLGATAGLLALDLATVITVHVQNVIEATWTYVLAGVLVVLVHLVILVQAGRAFAEQRAQEATEPEDGDEETEAEPA